MKKSIFNKIVKSFDLRALTFNIFNNLTYFRFQAQLRTFIPEMLKYSTGRSKPGWGKPEYRPIWWPNDLPWANVRSDVRTDQEKKAVRDYFSLLCFVPLLIPTFKLT